MGGWVGGTYLESPFVRLNRDRKGLFGKSRNEGLVVVHLHVRVVRHLVWVGGWVGGGERGGSNELLWVGNGWVGGWVGGLFGKSRNEGLVVVYLHVGVVRHLVWERRVGGWVGG